MMTFQIQWDKIRTELKKITWEVTQVQSTLMAWEITSVKKAAFWRESKNPLISDNQSAKYAH